MKVGKRERMGDGLWRFDEREGLSEDELMEKIRTKGGGSSGVGRGVYGST